MEAGAFSLRERQLAAISRMLNLDRDADGGRSAWHDPWKVLVYDAFCRDVISPLLKVGDLRKRGVTLHLLLDSDREQIADVPAVYFVRPTAANARRVAADCAAALYESFHLNFTPSIPRPMLESLASQTLESDCVAHVSRVMDQYLSFASLEDDLFSLQLPRAYPALTSPNSKDTELHAAVDEVVSGLFSVLVTLGVVPVLRYSRRGPAQAVAEGLGKRLHAQLRSHATLFSGAAAAALQRPLLVLVDRSEDLGAMLQHGWSYCALCHDLLGMRLNRLTVNETVDGGGASLALTRYCIPSRPLCTNRLFFHYPAPTCIARTIAILPHVYCAIYDAPPAPHPYCMPHTIHYWERQYRVKTKCVLTLVYGPPVTDEPGGEEVHTHHTHTHAHTHTPHTHCNKPEGIGSHRRESVLTKEDVNPLQRNTTQNNTMQHTAACMQHTAAHCSTLQRSATLCNRPEGKGSHENPY